MNYLIYTREIYIDEDYKVFVSYGAWRWNSQWQSYLNSSVGPCLGWSGWGGGEYLAGDAIITTSPDTSTLMTEQRPVCLHTPTQRQGHISLWVCHVRMYSTAFPVFNTPPQHAQPPLIMGDGNREKMGLHVEGKAPSSVTNDLNTNMRTSLVI